MLVLRIKIVDSLSHDFPYSILIDMVHSEALDSMLLERDELVSVDISDGD